MRRGFSCSALVAGVLVVALAGWVFPEATAQSAAPATLSGPAIEYHAEERLLTVHLNGLPLRQAMEELSKQTQIIFRPPAQTHTFDNRPITASFERMPIERAIKQLLGPSNTAMLYGRPQATGRAGNQVILTEVRVLDLGIIPIVATTAATDAAPKPPAAGYQNTLTPEQIQANRAVTQQKRTEKKQARAEKKGGRGSSAKSSSQSEGAQATDQQSLSTTPQTNTNQSSKSK